MRIPAPDWEMPRVPAITPEPFLSGLRSATESDVAAAFDGAYVKLPLATEAEALEFFNCMHDMPPDRER
jgi:hypothetical protein